MTLSVEKIKEQCVGLSAEERADVAFFLLDSLDDENEEEVADAWRAEVRAGRVVGFPAAQVFAEVRETYA